jgi:hypothetical protein
VKKILVLTLLALALPALPVAAGETAAAAGAPAIAAPTPADPAPSPAAEPDGQAQPDLAIGVPAPRLASLCTDTCYADFKICRNSCHSITCYNQCRAALDICVAECQ